MTTHEVAPGIYRIESILGPRPFAQYLLRDERSLLVDTGIVSTPDEVILPAFQRAGTRPGRPRLRPDLPRRRRPLRWQRRDPSRGAAGDRLRPRRGLRLDRRPGADPARALRLVRGARSGRGLRRRHERLAAERAGTGRAGRSPSRRRRGVSPRPASLGRGAPPAGSLAGAHRTLGSGLQERDHHRCRARRRAAQQRRRSDPSAALHAPRGVRGDRAPAATAGAGAAADRPLRRHGGSRRSIASWANHWPSSRGRGRRSRRRSRRRTR